jgi:hypothetical protein
MTPELFNMIGAVLLLVVGVVLAIAGMYRSKGEATPDSLEGSMIVVGLVLFMFGLFGVVACWAPLGQSLFGGGR